MIENVHNLEMKKVNFEQWDDDILSLDSKEKMYIIKNEGKETGIVLQFSLTKSCYATMVIREFLHNQISLD